MADYDSQLPVRSKQDPDERVQVKLVDFTTPSQGQSVDANGNAYVAPFGKRVDDASNVQLELSEEGKQMIRGDYEADDNSEPSSAGLIAHTRNAAKTQVHQVERVSAIASTVDTDVTALDVAIRNSDGNPFDGDSPLPVEIVENTGDEIHDFSKVVAVAKDATDDHDYSVVDGKTLLLYGVHCRASGKAKFELQIGDGAASEVFADKDVNFNSTAKPEADMDFYRVPIVVLGTVDSATVKVIRTNLDGQAQDLYSTIIGVLKDS